MRRAAHKLAHVHVHVVVAVLAFWVFQLVCWVAMMAYVQFFNPKLGNNVLYVTQISHWALVLSCGTAATATWGVITTRGRRRDHHEPVGQTTSHEGGQW